MEGEMLTDEEWEDAVEDAVSVEQQCDSAAASCAPAQAEPRDTPFVEAKQGNDSPVTGQLEVPRAERVSTQQPCNVLTEYDETSEKVSPSRMSPDITEQTASSCEDQILDERVVNATEGGNHGLCSRIKYLFYRCLDVLQIPRILIFDIILCVLDVGTDIDAVVVYFQQGNYLWASLTVVFITLPAVCWTALRWTYWRHEAQQTYRRMRMLMTILQLEPLAVPLRTLWYTCRREYCKCKAGCSSSDDDISEDERWRRTEDPGCAEYWDRKVNEVEKQRDKLLSAITTLGEDAPQISLQIYIIIGYDIQQHKPIWRYLQLASSLLSIFYATATLPHRVRLHRDDDERIRTFSIATLVLLVWRTLTLGSRILAFVLFASLFRYWLFVVIGFHYFLMFALVFYQMTLSRKPLTSKIIYNFFAPLIYIFDFCVNLLKGPTRYWYVMVYVPMYCENLVMSALMLWYTSTAPSSAWYIMPGCVCIIVMFPLGMLAQLAYYLYCHPGAPVMELIIDRAPLEDGEPAHTSRLQLMSWSEFRAKVIEANDTSRPYPNTHIRPMPAVIQ